MRRCPLCKSIKDDGEFLGICCTRCDKSIADAHADLVAELS